MFEAMWADLRRSDATPVTAATAASPGRRPTPTCASGSRARPRAAGSTSTEDRDGNQWAWWGDPDARGPGVVDSARTSTPCPTAAPSTARSASCPRFAAIDALRAAGIRARPADRRRELRRRGGRPVRRRLRGLAAHHRRADPDRARGLTDADGTTMADALQAAGRDPTQIGRDDEALRRIGSFVELHVEQGRGLVDLGRPVARRRRHLAARTVADGLRRRGQPRRHDPPRGPARPDARLRRRRPRRARGGRASTAAVATVGKVLGRARTASTPSRRAVTAWLDARGAGRARSRRSSPTSAVAEPHGGRRIRGVVDAATPFDAPLRAGSRRCSATYPCCATGAGHDAGILATAGIPTAMLFVRNPTGVSHSPGVRRARRLPGRRRALDRRR